MNKIEKYTEGKLDKASLNLFERKMKKNKNFRKKVFLYQNIDQVMQGAIMVASAELEMIENKIDVIATSFVNDYYRNNENPENIAAFLGWS